VRREVLAAPDQLEPCFKLVHAVGQYARGC
jgi:hypothetical protein